MHVFPKSFSTTKFHFSIVSSLSCLQVSTALGNEMKMIFGICKEDRQVLMTSLPVVPPMSITERATQNDALNVC